MEKKKLFFDIGALFFVQMFLTFTMVSPGKVVVSWTSVTILALCYLILVVAFYANWYDSGDYTELKMHTRGGSWYSRTKVLIFAHVMYVCIFATSLGLRFSDETVGNVFLVLSGLTGIMVYYLTWDHFVKKIDILSKI